MSNQTQLSTFNFETSSIRVISVNNEPWFVAKDVCNAIGLSNSRMALLALDDDEKGVNSAYTLGGEQDLAIVSESGMYTLILRCREAVKKGSVPHRFRKWVTAEVLPQIRKTGRYSKKVQPNLPLVIPNPSHQELLKLVMKLRHYAQGFADFQKSITSKAKNPKEQHALISSTFSSRANPDDSYLFVFKPNIESDLQEASDIIMKHVKGDF